jgi:hypothetical protein
MKIITIFGQRKEQYEGEYAPELLVAVDEYTNEINPTYLRQELGQIKELELKGTFEFIKIMEFEVPQAEFDRIFFGETLKASVIEMDK